MKILKRALLFTITTIIVIYLLLWAVRAFGFRSLIFAFLLNWLVMAWAATSSLFIPIAFAPSYYAIQPFEQNGRIYEGLGIRLFKHLIRRGPLAIFGIAIVAAQWMGAPGLIGIKLPRWPSIPNLAGAIGCGDPLLRLWRGGWLARLCLATVTAPPQRLVGLRVDQHWLVALASALVLGQRKLPADGDRQNDWLVL